MHDEKILNLHEILFRNLSIISDQITFYTTNREVHERKKKAYIHIKFETVSVCYFGIYLLYIYSIQKMEKPI